MAASLLVGLSLPLFKNQLSRHGIFHSHSCYCEINKIHKYLKNKAGYFPDQESSIAQTIPRDLNTVVFSLWAGFVPLITSPSSANTSACKQDTRSQEAEPETHIPVILSGQADPREDDITRLRHGSLSAVNIDHGLLHQHVVHFPPVWPAGSHCCSATREKNRAEQHSLFYYNSTNTERNPCNSLTIKVLKV